MIAAFGGNEEWLLKQLDPNSPEALRLCRYLRLKDEQTEDTGLAHVEERLQRRDSWQANLPDDDSNANNDNDNTASNDDNNNNASKDDNDNASKEKNG